MDKEVHIIIQGMLALYEQNMYNKKEIFVVIYMASKLYFNLQQSKQEGID